jgi:Tfp pilus assembly protein PilV
MAAITWRKTGVYVLLALPMLGLAGIAVIARQHQQDSSPQSSEDPVAAAARKAREQRKDSPKPKKVYTNEDVSSGSAAGAAPTSTAPSTPPSAAGSPSAPADTTAAEGAAKGPQTDATADTTSDTGKVNKNDEATWRKRFREVRGKLAEAEKEVDILQREANKAQTQYYSDPQKALSEQYNRKNINEHDTQIAAKKQEIAQLKQRLSDLEDELRKSGGDIGWTRE